MVKRVLAAVLALWSLAGTLAAQDPESTYAGIFRGKLPASYPYKYNGTYYWDRKEFLKGDVMYNGRLYRDIYMNVDAYLDELEVRPLERVSAMTVFRDQVAWFTMGPKTFVNLRYLGYTEAPEGFYEVIRDGETPLLLKVTKQLRFDGTSGGFTQIGYDDPDFNSAVHDFFQRTETYYALEKGQLKKIGSRNLRRRLATPAGEPSLGLDSVTWHSHATGAPQGRFAEANLPGVGAGLPDGYFAEIKADTVIVQYVDNPLLATYRNKVYTVGVPGQNRGNVARVHGTVTEAETNEPMYGVVVYDENTKTYTRTDRRGQYRINLPVGENVLHFSADGKEELGLRVQVHSDGGLDVVMTEKVTMLKEAVVSAESMAQHRNTEMGVEKVSVKTVNKIPSAFGEGDVIKAVLTLPGIKTVGEASGGFNVRGGSADQNLVLFNGNTIYNPSHLFGIFSAFNPDIVDNVELYKSSIPAEYGGRVSSVLKVDSKDGNMEKWGGSAGIGLLTSRLQLEGPIVKGKTSVVAGARTTYSDWILKRIPKEKSNYGGGTAGFTDANLGITHRINERNTIQAYGYYATDRFSFGGDTTFRYGNINASLVWKHRTEEGRLQISAGYDRYTSRISAHEWEWGAYDLDTYIQQAFLRADRKRKLTDEHELAWGVHVTGYALDPGTQNPYGENSNIKARTLDREMALEPAVYASDTWKPTDEFSVEGGVRLTGFYAQKGSALYGFPDVRLALKYSPQENLSFKAGVNSLSQNIHLISNTAAVSPMDTWKLSDDRIKPTWGWQAATGAYWTELNTGIDFSLEAYYKDTYRALDYLPGATLVMNPDLADDLVPVQGRSFGVELMARKTTGKITGWASYSYSRARLKEMGDRGLEAIARGNWYNAPYDKPHEFKLVTNIALTHRYSFSVNVDYSTGRPVTVPLGMYYYGGRYRMAYTERNAYRIPDYFRTDVAFNIDPGHYLKAAFHTTITLGVYNVTGRHNPYSVFFKNNGGFYGVGGTKGYMLSVFATQIPYINLNILF